MAGRRLYVAEEAPPGRFGQPTVLLVADQVPAAALGCRAGASE